MSTLTQAERDELIRAAAESTKEEFAAEVAARTSLTTAEVLKLAKTGAERTAMAETISIIKSAAAGNTAKASAIRQINGGVEALIKIVGLVL